MTVLPSTPPQEHQLHPTAPATASTPPAGRTPDSSEPVKANTQKRSNYQQFDDVYVTSAAGELWFIRVQRDQQRNLTIGNFHSQPKDDNWVMQALHEAARLSRSRSTIRIHTTETDITEAVRFGMRDSARKDYYEPLTKDLARNGKIMVLARPERETPIWRDIMKLIRSGETLLPSPFVTYSVHTAACTDFDKVYCGVILIGLGTVIVHNEILPGDDLVDAELSMVDWVLSNAGGGGRIDIHHSTDSARRVWEQVEALAAQASGTDALAFAGERLRNLVKRSYELNTQIMVGKRTNPTYARFAKATAASAFVGTEIL